VYKQSQIFINRVAIQQFAALKLKIKLKDIIQTQKLKNFAAPHIYHNLVDIKPSSDVSTVQRTS